MKIAALFLLALSLMPCGVRGQSPFDGTWRIETSTKDDPNEKPLEFQVSGGMYRSRDRVLKADGKDQSVPVTGYWDTARVRIVDGHTVEIVWKKAGKPTYRETDTVSADGNTLTQVVEDTTEAQAVTFENRYRRVAPAAQDAHILSGAWQAFAHKRSANSTIIRYQCTGEKFVAETPLGERLEAKLDGKFYPIEDDPGHTMVSVKLVDRYTIEQTNQRDGKVVFIVTLRVTSDGKTIHASSESKEDGSLKMWELHKQEN